MSTALLWDFSQSRTTKGLWLEGTSGACLVQNLRQDYLELAFYGEGLTQNFLHPPFRYFYKAKIDAPEPSLEDFQLSAISHIGCSSALIILSVPLLDYSPLILVSPEVGIESL